jgi:NADPH:quinone reductase-like Zn-dependent oxidoreductase
MKALVLEKYNELVYKDVPDPIIKRNEVLVRVMACADLMFMALMAVQDAGYLL